MQGSVRGRISADFLEFREAVGDPRPRNETVLTLDAKGGNNARVLLLFYA